MSSDLTGAMIHDLQLRSEKSKEALRELDAAVEIVKNKKYLYVRENAWWDGVREMTDRAHEMRDRLLNQNYKNKGTF